VRLIRAGDEGISFTPTPPVLSAAYASPATARLDSTVETRIAARAIDAVARCRRPSHSNRDPEPRRRSVSPRDVFPRGAVRSYALSKEVKNMKLSLQKRSASIAGGAARG